MESTTDEQIVVHSQIMNLFANFILIFVSLFNNILENYLFIFIHSILSLWWGSGFITEILSQKMFRMIIAK